MLIDPAVIHAVGTFDARLFAYCEEVDFSLRARRAGFGSSWFRRRSFIHGTTYTDARRAQRVYLQRPKSPWR
jgi:GT2 family glycosyltransferase